MKKRKNVTIQDRTRWIHEWQSNWENGVYSPFIRTQDVPSKGNKYRVYGISSGRVHHFLSTNEYLFFFVLEMNTEILNIYEQFPLLPIEKTISIAKELGIKHPRYPGTKIEKPFTSDFFVSMIGNENQVFSIKPEEDLKSDRTVEKQLIEKAYWNLQGIPWMPVTDREIKTTSSKNLAHLYGHSRLDPVLADLQRIWLPKFFAEISYCPFDKICSSIERASAFSGIDFNTGVTLFLNSIWNKLILIDWNQPIYLEKSPIDLGVAPNV